MNVQQACLVRAMHADGEKIDKEQYYKALSAAQNATNDILGKHTRYLDNPERVVWESILTAVVIENGGL